MSPEKETQSALWAACARALSPSKQRLFPHIQMQLPGFQFVPVAPCAGGNGSELCQQRFTLDLRRHFSARRVVKLRNGLPRGVVDAPSLSVSKRHLDSALNKMP